jgi:hypothetical protein
MNVKRTGFFLLLLSISGAVLAQQPEQKAEKSISAEEVIKRFNLPTGVLSEAVKLPKEQVKKPENTFGKVVSNLGQGIKQSLGAALENFLPFQFKYAMMLNESVEKVSNVALYSTIDEWYGTRYRYGGTTARGIDCSAFMQVLGTYAFGWDLPRTARMQYAHTRSIPRTDLKEGDLVFFNTTGGISHVGMYLQNNKFIHSTTSQGVVISDLTDNYWKSRFIGARRNVVEGNEEREGNKVL